MAIVESVKAIAKLTKEIGDIELKQKIIELQSEVLDLIEENHHLRMEKTKADDKAQIGDNLEFRNDMYFLREGDETSGPYCSPCWDGEEKLIRMHDSGIGPLCPVCIKGVN